MIVFTKQKLIKNTLLLILLSLNLNSAFSQKTNKSKNELKSGNSSRSSSPANSSSSSGSSRSSSLNDFGFAGLLAEGFLHVSFYSTIGD